MFVCEDWSRASCRPLLIVILRQQAKMESATARLETKEEQDPLYARLEKIDTYRATV